MTGALLQDVLIARTPRHSAVVSSSSLAFIENRGQLSDQFHRPMPEVLYYAESHGVRTYFTKSGQHFVFSKTSRDTSHDVAVGFSPRGRSLKAAATGEGERGLMPTTTPDTVTLFRADMTFLGASPMASLTGENLRDDYLNFYGSSCPDGLTNVRTYSSLLYKELYPHIDLAIRVEGSSAKYEYVVHPGGKVSNIQMQYDDREKIDIAQDGSLHVSNNFGELTDPKPTSSQSDGVIGSEFVLSGNVVSYHVESYDSTKDLLIDPPRLWGTYFGGSSNDQFSDIATDPSGNIYGAGITASTTDIATTDAFQVTLVGAFDAFLVKFSSSGARVWATYLCGGGNDYARGVAVDGNGDIVIAGWTTAISGVATNGAYQTAISDSTGNADCFIMKFTNSGTRVWGTYCGTRNADDLVYALSVDKHNRIYIGGSWSGAPGNYGSAFVAKFNSAGSSRLWLTVLPGSLPGDALYGMDVDAAGSIYVTGVATHENGFATTGAYQTQYGGLSDGFVAKLDSNGTEQWCSYYGGLSFDAGYSIAVARSGSIYVEGVSRSVENIATTGAYQTSKGAGDNAILSKWSNSGTLLWGTYYGSEGDDFGSGVLVDKDGNVLFAGQTSSTTQIATAEEFQLALQGTGPNAFLAEFDSTGTRLWGTYYGTSGTSGNPWGQSIALDSSDNIILVGFSEDQSGALGTSGAYQESNNGSNDGFVAKFCAIRTPTISSTSGVTICQGSSTVLSVPTGYSSYQWKLENVSILGATSNTYTPPTTLAPGTYNYSIFLTNSTGCSILSPTRTVTVGSVPVASAGANHTICVGDSVTIGGAASNGIAPYTYAWTPATGLSSATAVSPKASPASTTTYSVVATDQNGCHGSASVTVTVNPSPTLALTRRVETCAGTPVMIGANASGSTGPYSYSWAPSTGLTSTTAAQPTANPSAETKYFVTVTDGNTCHHFDSVDVVVNPLPVLTTSSDVSVCYGTSTQLTAMTTSGTGALTYAWTPTTGLTSATVPNPIASPTTTTSYQVTVTDAKGCKAVKSLTVSVIKPPTPVLLPGVVLSLCTGSSVTLSTKDPYATYLWSNGSTSSTITVSQNGNYTVTVTDGTGCSGTSATAKVSVHPHPTAAIAGPNSGCPNSTARYAAPSMAGVRYLWTVPNGGVVTAGGLDSVASILWTTLGTWKVDLHVTDTSTGCSVDTSYDVIVDAVLNPSITASGVTTLCQGDSVMLSAPSGFATYKWSNGSTTSSISVTKAGSYTVKVTDASGCSGTSQAMTVDLRSGTKPNPTISTIRNTLCDGDSVLLTASPGYSNYLWSDGSSTSSIYVHTSGKYSVAATNASGCQGTSPPVTITVLPSPLLSVSAQGPTTICEGSSVTLTASSGFSSYQWSNGATSESILAESAGDYTVTITNANGCKRTSSPITVTVIPVPSPEISGPVTVCANSTQTYSVKDIPGGATQWRVSGGSIQSGQGTSTITIQWSAGGSGSVDADQTLSGNGCEGSAPSLAVAIGTNLKPVIKAAGNRTSLCGATDSIILDAGSGYAHYSWTDGHSGQFDTVRVPSTVTVAVDDGAGCSGESDPIAIVSGQPPAPSVQSNGPLSFCEGDSVTLDAGSGYASYVWRINGAPIPGAKKQMLTVRQSGTYSVDVTNAAGCTGSSITTQVTVNPLPPEPTITEAGSLLTSSPSQTYQWNRNGSPIAGAISQSFTATSGDYTVTISDADGCERESLPVTITIQGITTASVPKLTRVQPGSSVSIPLMLSGSKNLTETGATTFAGTLRVDANVLTPTGSGATLVAGDWLIPISGSRSTTSDVLANISFTAGSRDPNCGALTIDTLYFPNALVEVSSVGGEVCVTSDCSPWVAPSDTALFIHSIIPNPSSGSFTIEYHIAADGLVSLQLEDMIGRTALILKSETVKSGTYREVYDATGLSSGVYRLQLRSGARVLNKMLEVAR